MPERPRGCLWGLFSPLVTAEDGIAPGDSFSSFPGSGDALSEKKLFKRFFSCHLPDG
jgi:hypothetical protein